MLHVSTHLNNFANFTTRVMERVLNISVATFLLQGTVMLLSGFSCVTIAVVVLFPIVDCGSAAVVVVIPVARVSDMIGGRRLINKLPPPSYHIVR